MTTSEYLAIPPRETSNSASTEHFAFFKNGTRFLPGAGTRLRFASKDTDSLSIPFVPAGFLAAGDTVTVQYKGVTVFRGTVESRVRNISKGDDNTESVVVCGPWSKMSRLVYRQYWHDSSGTVLSSRLVLNQHQSGSAQNLDSELREIANHAASACGYALGTVSVSSLNLPFDECRDITVADAIRRELRFFPRTVVYFNYSSGTPQLNIKRLDSGSADASYIASVPMTGRQISYTDHPITGVDLEIETVADGYRSIFHQRAGNTLAGNPDCLYATLQLAGASSNTVRQSFKAKSETIGDISSPTWWISKHPRLKLVSAAQLSISSATRSGESDKNDYPYISGNSVPEIEEAGLKCRVETFEATATITTADDKEENIILTMQFLTTNAVNDHTYSWVVSSESESGESVPSGLAAAILADRAASIRSERMTIRLGDSLPAIGDSCDGLCLQAFDVDCTNLTADLEFGAPDYLAPEDMASLLSGFRNKRRARHSFSRASGKPQDDATGDVDVGGIAPLSSTEFSPGRDAKKTFQSPSDSATGKVVIDTSLLPANLTVGIKTLTYTKLIDNTPTQTTAKIMASEDIDFSGGGTGVESLNELTGDLTVIGGEKIRVETDEEQKRIKIIYDENATDPDEEEDPTSNHCTHPGNASADGGVPVDGGADGSTHGGSGDGGANGGVPADNSDTHIGNNGCNCNL